MDHKAIVNEYQCPGCMNGRNTDDCSAYQLAAEGCAKHYAGTLIGPHIGKVYLGMPKGFCRLGAASPTNMVKDLPLFIFENWENLCAAWGAVPYSVFNVPVWKHLDKHGNTLVRGLKPRLNQPFTHVIGGDCRDRIDCREISQAEIDAMD